MNRGIKICEYIPFKGGFKEKIRLTKKYEGRILEVGKDYIIIY